MEKKIIEKIVESPATALDKTIQQAENVVKTLGQQEPFKEVEKYWDTLGPGLVTGAADDDPSGIATYSQSGAKYGFQFLWLAFFTFPLMTVVQEMCARIGIVTGRGLAANIKMHFPRWVLYTCTILLLAANTFNIGADLGAMAAAAKLLKPSLNFTGLIFTFTIVSLGLQIFVPYKDYARYLKFLALILFSYVLTVFAIHINTHDLIKFSLIPHLNFNKDEIFLVTGILGTTISPYLFFWQTSQEVEEDILAGNTTIKLRQQSTTNLGIKNMRVDVWSGMFVSNLVMFCIIAVCGATLHVSGLANIKTAADAADALKPLAGQYAALLFTLGIIGTGMLAVPVLAGSASYALSESFGWKQGLYLKLKQASAFYGVIIFSMFVGLLLNFVGLDPIKALIYSAVANGLVAPLVLILIVSLSSSKKVMGVRVNSKLAAGLGWLITAIMVVAGVATIATLLIPG